MNEHENEIIRDPSESSNNEPQCPIEAVEQPVQNTPAQQDVPETPVQEQAAQDTSARQDAPDVQGSTPPPVQPQYSTYYSQSYSYSQPQYRSQPQYTPCPPQQPAQPPKQKKKRNGRFGWRVAVLALCCALVGSLIGGAVVGGMLNDDLSELSAQVSKLKSDKTPSSGGTTTVIPTGSASGEGLSPAQIYAQNVDAVVAVVCETVSQGQNPFSQQIGTSSGTGFLITADGEILTNYHVIEGARKITVTLNDGSKYAASVVGYEAATDIALIKINGSNLQCVTLGDSDALVVGSQVTAIGNALGTLNNTLTVGYLSALDRAVSTDSSSTSMMQVDAAINSGNSGGPLFGADGTVIGITSAKYSGSTSSGATIEGIGFAIPINDVKAILSELRENGTVTNRAYLGISVMASDDPVGAEVISVDETACAYKAGLRVGDVITALNGKAAVGSSELVNSLRDYRAGETVTLTIVRGTEEMTLTVTLDAKPTE